MARTIAVEGVTLAALAAVLITAAAGAGLGAALHADGGGLDSTRIGFQSSGSHGSALQGSAHGQTDGTASAGVSRDANKEESFKEDELGGSSAVHSHKLEHNVDSSLDGPHSAGTLLGSGSEEGKIHNGGDGLAAFSLEGTSGSAHGAASSKDHHKLGLGFGKTSDSENEGQPKGNQGGGFSWTGASTSGYGADRRHHSGELSLGKPSESEYGEGKPKGNQGGGFSWTGASTSGYGADRGQHSGELSLGKTSESEYREDKSKYGSSAPEDVKDGDGSGAYKLRGISEEGYGADRHRKQGSGSAFRGSSTTNGADRYRGAVGGRGGVVMQSHTDRREEQRAEDGRFGSDFYERRDDRESGRRAGGSLGFGGGSGIRRSGGGRYELESGFGRQGGGGTARGRWADGSLRNTDGRYGSGTYRTSGTSEYNSGRGDSEGGFDRSLVLASLLPSYWGANSGRQSGSQDNARRRAAFQFSSGGGGGGRRDDGFIRF